MADVAVQNPKSLLQSNPTIADNLANRWHAFTLQYPTADDFTSFATLSRWAQQNNLPLSGLQDLWTGKEITDEYFAERETAEAVQEQTPESTNSLSSSLELLALPLLATIYLSKPKILEEDKDYQKIVQQKQDAWLKKNPEETFATKAGIDYLYGSLDDSNAPSLHKEAEETFREEAEKNPKLKKRLEKYDAEKKKIYKKAHDDATVNIVEASINSQATARHHLLTTQEETKDVTLDEVRKQVAESTWKRFAEEFPEKAAAYAPHHEDILKAHISILDEKRKKESEKPENKISIAEATKRLEALAEKTPIPQAGISLINTQGQILSTIPHPPPSSSGLVTTQGRPLVSSPTQESKGAPAPVTRPASVQQPSQKPQAVVSSPQQQKQEEDKKSNSLLRILWELIRDRLLKNLLNRLKSSEAVSRIGRGINSGLSKGVSGINSLASRSGSLLRVGRVGSLASGSASAAGAAGAAGSATAAAGGTAVGAGAAGGAAATAPIWGTAAAILGLILLIIIIIVFFFGQDATTTTVKPPPKTATEIPGLSINLQGPTSVENETIINYSITVTYEGPLIVSISDPIPENTEFVDAVPAGYSRENNTIVWKLKDIAADTTQKTFTLGISLKPKTKDSIVVNKVFAGATPSSISGNPNATSFNELMTGQGRNIDVLGNEEAFVAKVLASGGSYNLAGKEARIRQIYRAATAKNVNPLILLTTWGTEQGFGAEPRAFSCMTQRDDPAGVYLGFENQLGCAVNTWNNWMSHFDQNKSADGTLELKSEIGNTCIYSDPFLFASEKYGPLCVKDDANENFEPNFVKFYKQFLQ